MGQKFGARLLCALLAALMPATLASFGGEENIKRSDTCIILRCPDETGDTVTPAPAVQLDYSHYFVTRPEKLNTYDDFTNAWRWMLVNVSFEQEFASDITCKKDEVHRLMEKILESYNYAMYDYMEYSSFLREWSVNVNYCVDGSGNCCDFLLTLSLKNADGIPNIDIVHQISEFESACASIVTSLYESGELNTEMTSKEKAHVLYAYTALNTEYDTSCTKYTGYDAVVGHKAVCQGYVGMYNYLCNLAGVPMRGMTGIAGGKNHAWSRISDGGVLYNIDITWADPVPDLPGCWINDWFWLTDAQAKSGSDPKTFDIDSLGYGL